MNETFIIVIGNNAGCRLDTFADNDLMSDVKAPVDFLCVSLSLWPHLDVVPEVALRPDEDERREGRVSPHLGDPLLGNILERGGTDDAEAQQEHVGAGVTQRTQLVELLLEGSEDTEDEDVRTTSGTSTSCLRVLGHEFDMIRVQRGRTRGAGRAFVLCFL